MREGESWNPILGENRLAEGEGLNPMKTQHKVLSKVLLKAMKTENLEYPTANTEHPTPKCVRLANVSPNGTPFAVYAHLDVGSSVLAVGC
jgi:hypothetical protein